MAGEPGGKEVPWAEQAIRGTISLDVHARMPSGPDQHHDRIADQTMYAAKRGASTAYDPREIANTFLGGQALSLPPGTTNGITGHRGCSWVLLMQRQAQYKTGAAACVVFTVHIAVVACGDRAHQGQSQPHAARTFAGAG